MDIVKAGLGLVGTAAIAGWVAFSVSAPRNAENMMNQEMASLDGKSINETIADSKAEVRAEQCARFSAMAAEAWDRAVENDTTDRDATRIDELDRQVERFCN